MRAKKDGGHTAREQDKIIDWKAPNTGNILVKKQFFIAVKWHNCVIEYIKLSRLKKEKWYGKPRYEIIEQ